MSIIDTAEGVVNLLADEQGVKLRRFVKELGGIREAAFEIVTF
jgi:hypothetical protein